MENALTATIIPSSVFFFFAPHLHRALQAFHLDPANLMGRLGLTALALALTAAFVSLGRVTGETDGTEALPGFILGGSIGGGALAVLAWVLPT
jgi:hypothetical protein